MKPLLIDTGPIVALLNGADSHHDFVRAAFAGLPAGRPMVTSAAVVTEVMFLMEECRGGPRRAVEFFEEARLRVDPVCSPSHLDEAVVLMERYADVPMDFADATLVLLACHYGVGDVVTLDERGFQAYRYLRHTPFRLLLQRAE